jgi:proline dehydrogenase
MQSLRQKNIGALFCYNVEPLYDAPEDYVPDPRADVEETIKSIRVASQFEKDRIEAGGNDGARTWVSLKISGLMADPLLLKRRTEVLQRERVREEATTGEYPYLVTDGDWERLWSIDREDAWQSLRDVVVLDEAYENLREIMSKAKEEGIRVFIDAEQTWYQPAIDVLQEKLMREFNGKEELPIVCATYQAYLRRCEGMVSSQLARAEAGGFSLGMKLVRGEPVGASKARVMALTIVSI